MNTLIPIFDLGCKGSDSSTDQIGADLLSGVIPDPAKDLELEPQSTACAPFCSAEIIEAGHLTSGGHHRNTLEIRNLIQIRRGQRVVRPYPTIGGERNHSASNLVCFSPPPGTIWCWGVCRMAQGYRLWKIISFRFDPLSWLGGSSGPEHWRLRYCHNPYSLSKPPAWICHIAIPDRSMASQCPIHDNFLFGISAPLHSIWTVKCTRL